MKLLSLSLTVHLLGKTSPGYFLNIHLNFEGGCYHRGGYTSMHPEYDVIASPQQGCSRRVLAMQ